MWTKCFFLVVEEGLEEVFLVEDALSFREEERDQVVEAMPFGPPPAEDLLLLTEQSTLRLPLKTA